MANIQINDTPQRVQYIATAAQDVFPVPFPFLLNSDIDVYNGSTLLVEGGAANQYALTGAGAQAGGTVTLNTPVNINTIITIVGDTPVDRTSIYSPVISNLTGDDLNSDFNRDVIMIKQQETTQDFLQLRYAPFAEVSQDLSVTRDRVLPLLPAGAIWQMNADRTAIIATAIPTNPIGVDGSFTIDNRLVRTDLTPGNNFVQQSNVTLDDAGNMTGVNSLTLIAPITQTQQAATKGYVDGVATGFEFKDSAVCATTEALAADYANGPDGGNPGVGATLTNTGVGIVFSVDGVTPVVGDRVLFKDQANAEQNGIYTLTVAGTADPAGIKWIVTRALDHDEASEMTAGVALIIDQGVENALSFWVQTSTVVTVGVTPVTFSKLGGSSNAVVIAVNQVAHGLDVGNVVYFNGVNYVKGIATDAVQAETIGVVATKINDDSFSLQVAGEISLSGLISGTVYWLSGAIAGTTSTTPPGTLGFIKKPVYLATSASTAILLTFVGDVVGGAVPGGNTDVPTQVTVRSLSDFPVPIAGVIALAGSTQYLVQGNINIGANVLDFANFGTSISGIQSRATFLTGATATPMLTTSNGDSVEIRDITITQAGAGALIDVILINFNRFDIINCRLSGGSLIGRSGSTLQLNSTFMFGGCGFLSAAPGITFVVFSQCAIVDSAPGDVLLDFPAAAPTADFQFLNGALTTTNGGTAIRTFDPDLIGLGTVTDSAYTGVGALFDGISQASDTWLMANNTGMPTSNDQGSTTVSGAGTVVAIAAINTFADITDGGVGINWTLVAGAEKFTLTNPNTGELTYNGVRDLAFGFGGFLTMSRVGGTDLNMKMAIVVNDVPLVSSISAVELDTNTVFTIYVPWFKVIMNSGDRVRLQIENTTNATDIELFDVSLSVGR